MANSEKTTILRDISSLKFLTGSKAPPFLTGFTEKYGGKVFYVISVKDEKGKKIIYNQGVIEEIRAEIERLKM